MIKDPLTHMVRNSADHGIEDRADALPPESRRPARSRSNAYHESGHIFIRIADDGRGLDAGAHPPEGHHQRLATEAAARRR